MALQHLRASTANKRPTPAAMADGQLAVNTAAVSPGLFFKDAGGALVKVGPIHVGTTAPNATPASGGQAGNSIGEQWLDTSNSRFVFKVWDGTAWRTEDGEFVNARGDTMTGALVMDNQQQIRFRETTANGTNFIALQAPASVASDKTITLPDVTGTVVTTGDTGSVTSTMLLDGTIVNADINASAAIVDTKLATIATAGKVSNSATTATNANTASAIVARDASGNFSAGTITAALTGAASANVLKAGDTMTGVLAVTAGTAALPAITPSGDPNTGIYSPGADQLAISTNGTGRLFVDASGRVLVGTATAFETKTQGNVALTPSQQGAANTTAGSSQALFFYGTSGTARGNLIFSRSNSTTVGAHTVIGGSAHMGGLIFTGSDGTSFVPGAEIFAASDGTPGTNIMPGRLIFGTTPSGSGTPTERMRLDSSGRLGLGTSAPEQKFEIAESGTFSRSLVFQTSVSSDCYITAKATGASTSLNTNLNLRADGSGAHGTVIFSRGLNRTYIESMRIDSSGRVGIGTTSPAAPLQVNDGSYTLPSGFGSSDLAILARNANLDLSLMSGNASVANINFGDTDDKFAGQIKYDHSTNHLAFRVNAGERARIDSSGRLLVGTSSARSNYLGSVAPVLQVNTALGVGFERNSNDNNPLHIWLGKSRGTSAGDNTIVNNGDNLAAINFTGADGAKLAHAARISVQVDGAPGLDDMPGRIILSTTSSGSSSPTERLRITNAGVLQVADAGNISVGTTTGTKIGTATTQKLGFYNATPVVQPTAVADATDAASVITQLNALLARMRDLGLIAT
jgi:hypothetical protein